MNLKGNTWLVTGSRDVGKTFTAMQLAEEFFLSPVCPKSIVVFDHSNNDSYLQYPLHPLTLPQIPQLDWLAYPFRAIVRGDEEQFDEFCHLMTHFSRRTCIVFDDCGIFFEGNLTQERKRILKTPKNNENELIFQGHNYAEMAPRLLRESNMYVIKQTTDDPDELPDKVIAKKQVRQLMIEVIQENYQRPPKQKWATRIYDTETDEVWLLDPVSNTFQVVEGQQHFPFSALHKYRPIPSNPSLP